VNPDPTSEAALVQLCLQAADAMSVYVERVGQWRADKAGSDPGVPDLLLYVHGRCIPCELKRARDRQTHTPCGKLSYAQIVAQERRRDHGVETVVVTCLDDFVNAVNAARRPAR
jgi:hypothetical protein